MKKSLGLLAVGLVLAIPAIVSADTPRVHLRSAELSCEGADLRLDFRLTGLDDFEDARIRLTARAEVDCMDGHEHNQNITEVESFEANGSGHVDDDISLSAEDLCHGEGVEDVTFRNIQITVVTEGRVAHARIAGSKHCNAED